MEENEHSGLVRQAKAVRDKYSTGPKMQIVIDFLGPHPKNRGGQYPSHEAVIELCCKLIKEGFDVDEANHMGVCVSELDSEQQGSAGSPKDDKTGKYQTYTAYSEEMRRGRGVQRCLSPRPAGFVWNPQPHAPRHGPEKPEVQSCREAT